MGSSAKQRSKNGQKIRQSIDSETGSVTQNTAATIQDVSIFEEHNGPLIAINILDAVRDLRNNTQDIVLLILEATSMSEERRNKLTKMHRRLVQTSARDSMERICKQLHYLNATAPCSRCNATGEFPTLDGTAPTTCSICRGTGWEPCV